MSVSHIQISWYIVSYSCWISSDDGTIAAFIVPIVAIMLVIHVNSVHITVYTYTSLQINCVFLVIALKVLWKNKQKLASRHTSNNKETAKYGYACM